METNSTGREETQFEMSEPHRASLTTQWAMPLNLRGTKNQLMEQSLTNILISKINFDLIDRPWKEGILNILWK